MKKDGTYSLLLTLDKVTVNVSSARRTCPAGQGPYGSCKHLAALCFALKGFVKIQGVAMEQGEDACTSLLQKWSQSRKKRLESKKVEDIDLSSIPYSEKGPTQVHQKPYDPRSCNMQKTMKSEN